MSRHNLLVLIQVPVIPNEPGCPQVPPSCSPEYFPMKKSAVAVAEKRPNMGKVVGAIFIVNVREEHGNTMITRAYVC